MTRRRISAIAAVLMAAGICLPLPRAAAQFELPAEIITATTLSGDQTQQVRQYVQEPMQRLKGADGAAPPDAARELKRARDQLLSPMRNRAISVRFRQEYTNLILPELKPLAESDSELMAINALRIGGELATNDAAALLESKLADESVAIRYAAMSGIGRTFDALAETSPAMTQDRVRALMQTVAQRLEAEPSGMVVDAGVRALVGAMNIAHPGFEDTRSRAFVTLARGVGNRLKAAGNQPYDPDLATAVLRAGETGRIALTINDPSRRLNDEAARHAGELSGHMVAYVSRRLKDFPHDQPELRESPAQLLIVAETALPLAVDRLATRRSEIPRLSEDFRKSSQAGDRDFFRKSLEFIGMLQREPFNFPVGHFLGEQAPGPG